MLHEKEHRTPLKVIIPAREYYVSDIRLSFCWSFLSIGALMRRVFVLRTISMVFQSSLLTVLEPSPLLKGEDCKLKANHCKLRNSRINSTLYVRFWLNDQKNALHHGRSAVYFKFYTFQIFIPRTILI